MTSYVHVTQEVVIYFMRKTFMLTWLVKGDND
jgi:hypothetical protein